MEVKEESDVIESLPVRPDNAGVRCVWKCAIWPAEDYQSDGASPLQTGCDP